MSTYILVENKTSILLGPMSWRPRFIQSELNDIDIAYTVPFTEQGYIKVSDTPLIEIFPVVEVISPSIDSLSEKLSGPTYTYNNNTATETWGKDTKDLESIKQNLKQMIAVLRYTNEVKGTTAVVQGQTVTIDTARGSRDIFVQQYLLLPVNGTTNWKFPETWLTLTKTDLELCVSAGVSHVQGAFNWEQSLCTEIDAASTILELQTIHINTFPQNSGMMGE